MTPEFLYDFGSPNAYLAWRVLPEVEARTGVAFARKPVLLGGIFKETGNQSPFYTYANVRGRIAYEQLEIGRFRKKHGIDDFRFNPNFPQNSLTMMRGALAAEEMDRQVAYTEACFRGMWEEELRMDDADVLHARLLKAGLDATAIMTRANEADIKTALVERTNDAVARGVFGLPSFFVGDEMFFGKDRLTDVEIEILRHNSGRAQPEIVRRNKKGAHQPGWDARAISRISQEHYGGLREMFEAHGWSERGSKMMTVVQRRVAERWGSIAEFVEAHETTTQNSGSD